MFTPVGAVGGVNLSLVFLSPRVFARKRRWSCATAIRGSGTARYIYICIYLGPGTPHDPAQFLACIFIGGRHRARDPQITRRGLLLLLYSMTPRNPRCGPCTVPCALPRDVRRREVQLIAAAGRGRQYTSLFMAEPSFPASQRCLQCCATAMDVRLQRRVPQTCDTPLIFFAIYVLASVVSRLVPAVKMTWVGELVV